jgi:hypothetical protein
MLSTVLERRFLVVQLLFQISNIFAQGSRFGCQALVQGGGGHCDEPVGRTYQSRLTRDMNNLHLPDAFVDVRVFGQGLELIGRQLIEPGISSFGRKFSLRLSDLLLGEDCLCFDLLEQLHQRLAWAIRRPENNKPSAKQHSV